MNSEHVSGEIEKLREEISRQLEKERKEKEELWEVIGVLRDEINGIEKQNRIEHTLIAKSILELRDMIEKPKSICIGRIIDSDKPLYVPMKIMDVTMNEENEIFRGEFFTGLRLFVIQSTANVYELSNLKRIPGLKNIIINHGYRFELNGVEVNVGFAVADYLKESGIAVYCSVKNDDGVTEYIKF